MYRANGVVQRVSPRLAPKTEVVIIGRHPPLLAGGSAHTCTLPSNDTLNMRDKSSASSKVIFNLVPNSKIYILNEAMNGSTKWFYIGLGWVAAKYIKEN